MELFLTLVSLVFVVATYVFTFVFNQYHFDVIHFSTSTDRNHVLFTFDFINDSPRAIEINNVEFMDKTGNVVPILNFDPGKYDEVQRKKNYQKYEKEHHGDLDYFSELNPYKLKPIELHPEQPPTVLPIFAQAGKSTKIKFYLASKPSSLKIIFSRKLAVGLRFLFIPKFAKSALFRIGIQY